MIAPSPSDQGAGGMQQPTTANGRSQVCSTSWVSKLRRLWFSLQVSHSGSKYSIERLLALEEYTRHTSLARVLLVCFGTPTPMVVLVMLQECVPLQDPSDGWSANYGFWIRTGVLGGVVAVGMAAFALYMIPGVVLSNLQLVFLFVGQAICYPFVAMLVASLWVFPIPFMVLTIISLYVMLFAVLFRIIAGKEVFSQMGKHQDEIILLVSFSSSQSVMAVSYAAYQILFDHVTSTHFELPIILLLPVIKLIMKNLVSRCIVHMKDMVPEAVIFTVDFFNSLYLATCMQNTSSITTIVAMMALDFTQTAVALRCLHRRTNTIVSRLNQAGGALGNANGLLPSVSLLCSNTDKFEQQNRDSIVIDSCLPHKLSSDGRALLDKLRTIPGNGIRSLPRFSSLEISSIFRLSVDKAALTGKIKPMWKCRHRSLTRIRPSSTTMNAKHVRSATKVSSKSLDTAVSPHQKILGETLEVLFTSECLILTEYLESVIPVLYGQFILLVVNLPSAKYHMDLIGVTRENVGDTLRGVYLYALLEFASFVTLTVMMMRNCRLQALYHLAFVLETQMLLVQVKLMTWVLMTLSFRVVHFGAYFSRVFVPSLFF
ncbi:unnamed protein product [Phytophthora lilii]|uniref:Unnamed protein product n=1 Tax=Phytophthora lilii TaxID=2077276 RepID=A0A9W6WNY7_9STRA|nr:unnamed protein product [Phytophthora lilii]